ncbi:phosphorothioated DNA-binding restriction endonuclease [Ramlibacter sp.]|uniref:phosphorothioated DNA-binding restriction endonuclease n=1 Tax=Ramlibacter sp. TaxID=1917967 RepID=UPI0035B08D67
MKTAAEILAAFDNIRRAQNAGVYAPHKPLLILLALARVQRGEPRLVDFNDIEGPLKRLLVEFGRSGSANTRHLPFWHLRSDGQGAIWKLSGPRELLARPAATAPNLGELRLNHVRGGFPIAVDKALREQPGLLEAVAAQVMDAAFPETLHADIAAAVGLSLDRSTIIMAGERTAPAYVQSEHRHRDPGFRERVLRAYEYRCCVCGFDLRIGQVSAGLEAAHIQWHNVGGPDVEPNGLSLCSLHHKLFDLGAFTVEPSEFRVVFSQQAIGSQRGRDGELRHHGRPILPPQQRDMLPAPQYLGWNFKNVFKTPARRVGG